MYCDVIRMYACQRQMVRIVALRATLVQSRILALRWLCIELRAEY